jgi:glycosyltransferase involved in cell wall biosynthesis
MLGRYYASEVREHDEVGMSVHSQWGESLMSMVTRRWWPTLHKHLANESFDHTVAGALVPVMRFTGFAGKTLHSMTRARALGAERLEVVAPNAHVRQVQRLHAKAAQHSGFRDTWLGEAQIRKTCKEYEAADKVLVHSDYVWESLVEYGVPERKLSRTVLRIPARFHPPSRIVEDGVFRIVYVGRLDATKGIGVLLEAFRQLPIRRAELYLVGGWTSRPMRRRCIEAVERDSRIRISPGDPVPVLQEADVYVHPTFEDGYAYSAVEALACGVPVVVTDQTGMKEYVREGENGYVVATGNAEALLERMLAVQQHPLRSTKSLLPAHLVVADDTPESLAAPSRKRKPTVI